MEKGKLIAVIGLDGVGKTTQANSIYNYLVSKHIPCARVHLRKATTKYVDIIDNFMKNDMENMDMRTAVTFSHFCDTYVNMRDIILPMLDMGTTVILDKYISGIWSFMSNLNVEEDFLDIMKYSIMDLKHPDVTILLDAPAEFVNDRVVKRDGELSMKNKDIEIVKKTRSRYLEFVKGMGNITIIDATENDETVKSKVLSFVDLYLN